MSPTAPAAPDSVALSRLVREQHDALVRSIMGVTGLGRHDAEDVLSIVTLRVLLNGVTTEPECWFRYMRDAARNEASNARRADRRRAARHAAAALPATTDPHVDAITARIVWLDVMQAVDELPHVERQIVQLHYFNDQTYEQIAVELDLTRSGVDNRMRQARERLRTIMAERESDQLYSAMLTALAGSIAARMAEVARRAGALAPSAVAVAGVTALSVLAVLAAPAPPAGHAATRHQPTVTAPPAATVPATVGDTANGRGAGPAWEGATNPPTAPTAPRRGARFPLDLVPAVPQPGGCAGPVCVGNGDTPGDRMTLRRLPNAVTGQSVTPLCWAVPDNPELECRGDDPDAYAVPRPAGPPQQDRHGLGRKSSPSVPEYRKPLRGTR